MPTAIGSCRTGSTSRAIRLEASEQLAGDLIVTLDPPRQQKFRRVLNPYFSPARMKALAPEIRFETDRLIDTFIEQGTGDLAQVAWRQPGIVFFKYGPQIL